MKLYNTLTVLFLLLTGCGHDSDGPFVSLSGTVTVVTTTATSVSTSTATGVTGVGTYVGCFTDENTRALPTLIMSSNATVELCAARVKTQGYKYAGLQDGGYCFGGNTLGYVQVLDTDCNMKCSANSAQICGGSWLNSIYSTGL